MKKVVFMLLLMVPFGLMAQKEVKPSLPKADKAFKDGKLDEAKAIIDVTTTSEKFANSAKAWYLKGMIYVAIDTTKNAAYQSLETDPFGKAMEAFKKAEELDGGKSEYLMSDKMGLPLMKSNVNANLANFFYTKAADEFQTNKDYKKAYANIKKTVALYPDTVFLSPAGIFFAPQAEEYDQALVWINEYLAKGGTSQDAYIMLFSIWRDKKKDNNMALKVIKEARVKFPQNPEFPKYELNLYITTKQYDVARQMIEADLKANPNDKEGFYLLGELNKELKDVAAAKAAYQKAVDLDASYFDALAGLTDLYWLDAKEIKDEMGKLGIAKEDMAKRQALDKVYVERLKTYVPYLERCEKLEPDNVNILYQLMTVYTDLDDQPKLARVKKNLKRLGEDVD